MRISISSVLLGVVLSVAAPAPAAAANKEHQQLAADIRMLQEQAQILQNMLGSIGESIKGVSARLDDQNNAMRKAFADQKLQIDNLSSDLRVVREKVDDNNVRITSLTHELDALRKAVQQATMRPAPSETGGTLPPGTAAPSPTTPQIEIGASPQKLYEMAWSDYTIGQWDLAIQGFESYIRTFPTAGNADEAQVKIGVAYDYLGNKQKALEAFDKAIRDYPKGKAIPEAYFRKGLVLKDLKQPDRAREAFEFVVKNYPAEAAAGLAKQQLDQIKKP